MEISLEGRISELLSQRDISEKAYTIVNDAESSVVEQFKSVDDIRSYNQYKVISAMQNCKVSDTMFAGTTGYGYDDRGRDVLDEVYAQCFGAESAIVRTQIVSGTQALALCLYGILRPGKKLLSITGKPYDTLDEVIGLRGEGEGSLRDFGIGYEQVDLKADGSIDLEETTKALSEDVGLVLIQRSGGYGNRAAFSISQIEEACTHIKKIAPDVPIMVDNCYGEFVDYREPTEVGADIMAGSLIKNPGGGIAPTGGYVAGKKKYVELAANRLTTPGLGSHVGPSLGNNRLLFQGLFFAPHVVGESVKGAILCAKAMETLGYETLPSASDKRNDIIQAVRFGSEEPLISFCQGIQAGSAVDSYVEPQPWDMPGYDSPVIMAAGAFVQGSSIELSADAPIKPPYTAYMQGGLVYESVKLGIMKAISKMINE